MSSSTGEIATATSKQVVEPSLALDRFRRLAEAVRLLCEARSADEIIETVRACARQLCGSSGIAIVLREDDLCHYVAEDSAVALWTGRKFPMVACISGWAMINRQQVLISDIFADPRVPHEAYRPTGIQSLVMTPVGSPPIAALGAYWNENRVHSAEEVAILRALAECMAGAFRTIELRDGLNARRVELERRRALLEAARREVAFQTRLLDIVEEAVVATDLEGRVVYWNAFAEQLYGWSKQEAIGKTVLELKAGPAEHEVAAALLKELQAGKAWAGELMLRRKDGAAFPAYVRDWPVHDDTGAMIGIVGISWDNSEQRRIEQHQRLLINELNHRVKNSLTVVQSIAHQTLPSGEGAGAKAREAFHERLHALARAHGLIMESGWGPVSVLSLAETGLEPFGYRPGDQRFHLDGPHIIFAPNAAVTIALALHELGTNAAKYGALSNQTGTVSLAWALEGAGTDARVILEWTEAGGPPVTPPTTRGFGSRLIERGLSRELGGEVSLGFDPAGLSCRIVAPAAAVLLPAEEAASLAARTVVIES